MLTEELLLAFNPSNAKNVTAEQLAKLRSVTDQELQQLASKYPNRPTGPFLLLHDKNAKVQLYGMSSYVNLLNLRVKQGQKQYSIHDFKTNFKVNPNVPGKTLAIAPIQDLTATDLEKAPLLQKAPVQNLSAVKEGSNVAEEEPDELEDIEDGDTDAEFEDLDEEAGNAVANASKASKGAKKATSVKKASKGTQLG